MNWQHGEMKNMINRILIDTNVLLDDLMLREPHAVDSRQLLELCRIRNVDGFVAAHSITNMFYIMRKYYSAEERRRLLKSICIMFHVVGIDENKLIMAIDDESFDDFEDCLQGKCAADIQADYIVTWNTKDYIKSQIPAITPAEFLFRIRQNAKDIIY